MLLGTLPVEVVAVISSSAILSVSLMSAGVALTPGPNMVHLAARSISQGRRAGMVALSGVAVGFATYLVATVCGLSALFVAVPMAFTVVKWAGVGYLLWLAISMARPGTGSPFSPTPVARQAPWRLFGMGLVTNLLNPKIALLYASLLPLLVEPGRGPSWSQLLQLGMVQIVVAVVINSLVVLGSGQLSRFLQAHPRLFTVQRFGSAALLGFFAFKLAGAQAAR